MGLYLGKLILLRIVHIRICEGFLV